MCAVVWHLLVSHPALQASATKWESLVNLSTQIGTTESQEILEGVK
jgi:hypothetical protein